MSFVNDPRFRMFKEYFNPTIKDTETPAPEMETIISVAGPAGVLIINQFYSLIKRVLHER